MLRPWKKGDQATVITTFMADGLFPGDLFVAGEKARVDLVEHDEEGAVTEVWLRFEKQHPALRPYANCLWLNDHTMEWASCILRNADFKTTKFKTLHYVSLTSAMTLTGAGAAWAEVIETVLNQDSVAVRLLHYLIKLAAVSW